MALFRKLFHRKPPDGLLEICERLYVFDCCFTTEIWEEENYKVYVGGIIGQLRDHFLDASLLVFNFREEETQSQMAETLSEYDITIMDYPRQYVGCPLLTMEVIHHFLRSSESWLSLGPQNVLLMHCERGGWPVLAFMLAALLIYRKQYTGEHRTLEMVYKQAPHEFLQMLSPLNPLPSQLRYLQYVSRRNVASEWPPLDRALTLDCVILRLIPNFGAEEGCRPIFRVYGHDPFLVADRSPKVLYSTPKRSKTVRLYKQAECELVKIDINCHIQGDVVLECISLNDDMEHEEMMFRAMFNTAFVRSNILILNRDEIDTLWNAKDQFPKEFRAEVLFSEMDAAAFSVPDDLSCFAEKEGLPLEAFAKVQEIFSHVDWLDPKTDAALNVLHHITTSNIVHEKLDTNSHQSAETIPFPQELSPEKFWEKQKSGELKNNLKGTAELENNSRSPTPMAVENLSAPSLNLAPVEVAREKKVHSKSQQAVLQPPSQSEKICQQTPQSNPVFCNSVQSTPVSVPRCHSAPSAFGLSPLFQADASSKSVEVTYSRTTSLAVPPLTPDMSCVPTSTEQKSISILPPAPPPPSATACSAQTLPSPPPPPPHFTASKPTHPSVAEKPETHLQGRGQPSLGGLLTAPGTISPCKTFNESLYDSPFPVLDSTPSPPKRKPPPTPPPPPMMTPHRLPTPRAPSPPPTPHLKESPAIRAGPPPPPPPSPPVMTPPTLRTPPPPPPLKEGPTIRAGPPPPPPPPPMMTPPRLPTPLIPLPPPPLKDSPTIRAGPPPPPPPPLRTGKAAGPSISSLVPPPPPTPTLNPALHNSKHVPSAPPPPVPFGKGFFKTDAAASESPSAGNNKENGLSRSPSRGPSFISSGTAKGRGLSRTISPRNHQIKKLKPLHWLKLTRAAQGSLWAEAQKSDEASKAPEIDMSELESLFSVVDSGGKSSLHASGPKSDKVQLIDHRRAYNCEIMLSKVKVSLHDLMSSVLALDDSALDVDQVDNLIKFCPTKEEMELLKGYNGEKEKLGKCEQFFLELMQVPRVESKLRVFSFKIQFRSQVSDLRTGLNVVNSAAEEMRNSVKLKRIMQTILSLGNALNQGTARGSAIGFRLDSLLKLTDTRAKNNKMTLMHYLCKVVADKLPELLDFSNDLGSLESASKIQLKFLAEEMQAVSKGLDKVVQELSLSENDGPVSETFRRILKEFLCVAEAEVRSLASLYSGVGKHADALILYFGEDPSRCPFEQVVSTLHNFVRMFKHAHEENCKQLVLEKKAAEKESDIKKLKIAASA